MRAPAAVVTTAALALAAATIAVAPAVAKPAPSGATASDATFSCRASLVRTENTPGGVLDVEPVVANPPNDPCVGEDAALVDALNPLVIDALATVRAVYIASTLQRPVKFIDVLEGRYDDVDVSRGIRLPPN